MFENLLQTYKNLKHFKKLTFILKVKFRNLNISGYFWKF